MLLSLTVILFQRLVEVLRRYLDRKDEGIDSYLLIYSAWGLLTLTLSYYFTTRKHYSPPNVRDG